MKAITLNADVDDKGYILLPAPGVVKNKQFKVVLIVEDGEEENDWLRLSKEKLADAFAEDEPQYSLSMIKEPNPQYQKNAKR